MHIAASCHVNNITLLFFLQVGLFRKSGVKSRIQALRQMNENSPDNVSYEDQSAYDVADMVKQFFRDLPEPLLTSKLGETFLHIYQCKDVALCLSFVPWRVLILLSQLALFKPGWHCDIAPELT